MHNITFFWLPPRHMEVPGPGIEPKPQVGSPLQLWQCWVLNPLRRATDGTLAPGRDSTRSVSLWELHKYIFYWGLTVKKICRLLPLSRGGFLQQKIPLRESLWWLSRLRTQLVSMRMQVLSLASLSGLRTWHCCELWCRSQMPLESCVAVAVV